RRLADVGCRSDGADRFALVAVFDRVAVLVDELACHAFRVGNPAAAADRYRSPIATLQRPVLPGQAHLFDNAVACDARHQAGRVTDMAGIGATQIAVAMLTLTIANMPRFATGLRGLISGHG